MKELRKAAGISSMNALAHQIGADKNQVWEWESGRRAPGTEYLEKIARVLGVPIDKLFDDDAA